MGHKHVTKSEFSQTTDKVSKRKPPFFTLSHQSKAFRKANLSKALSQGFSSSLRVGPRYAVADWFKRADFPGFSKRFLCDH